MSDSFRLGYIPGTSMLHRLDPLTKMLALAGVIIFGIGALPLYNVIMLAFILLLVPFSGVSLKTFLQPWKILIPLWIPFIILPPILFNLQSGLIGVENQSAIFEFLSLKIAYSQYGLNYGLKVAARGTVICIASLLLLWTTHPRELVQSFVEQFRAPYKYAWSAFLALIYVPIVSYEARMRNYALRIRGVRFRKMSLSGLKIYAIPIVLRSLRRGFTTALSMESRGFGIYSTRVFRYEIQRPKYVHAIRLVLVILFALAIYAVVKYGSFSVLIHPNN